MKFWELLSDFWLFRELRRIFSSPKEEEIESIKYPDCWNCRRRRTHDWRVQYYEDDKYDETLCEANGWHHTRCGRNLSTSGQTGNYGRGSSSSHRHNRERNDYDDFSDEGYRDDYYRDYEDYGGGFGDPGGFDDY